ncbi:MAG: hypothetical protein ACI898_001157, partial [Flavobacteriales bacterium]
LRSFALQNRSGCGAFQISINQNVTLFSIESALLG